MIQESTTPRKSQILRNSYASDEIFGSGGDLSSSVINWKKMDDDQAEDLTIAHRLVTFTNSDQFGKEIRTSLGSIKLLSSPQLTQNLSPITVIEEENKKNSLNSSETASQNA